MEPTPSTESLDGKERATLIQVAKDSVHWGVEHYTPLAVHPAEYGPALKVLRASFVTLERDGQLRGCMGHLSAFQPLVVDVAENAYAAAFRDPRFPPVQSSELEDLDFHVSVLSPPEPMQFDSEADLLRQLTPGIDGLILEEGTRRGTFLPSVWDSLADPVQFLTHLKLKTGLAPNHWSDTLKVSRYRTESFGEETA